MRYDPMARLLLTPIDREGPDRVRRLRGLGLTAAPQPAFDAFARQLAHCVNAPFAMVNFMEEDGQFLAGLHAPTSALFSRLMGRERGYCPHVVARRKALVLEDVRDFPRFAGNPLVDEAGIRSYLGAPLIDRTGIALGTVCVADIEPRRWGREGLDTVKSVAADVVHAIHRGESGAV